MARVKPAKPNQQEVPEVHALLVPVSGPAEVLTVKRSRAWATLLKKAFGTPMRDTFFSDFYSAERGRTTLSFLTLEDLNETPENANVLVTVDKSDTYTLRLPDAKLAHPIRDILAGPVLVVNCDGFRAGIGPVEDMNDKDIQFAKSLLSVRFTDETRKGLNQFHMLRYDPDPKPTIFAKPMHLSRLYCDEESVEQRVRRELNTPHLEDIYWQNSLVDNDAQLRVVGDMLACQIDLPPNRALMLKQFGGPVDPEPTKRPYKQNVIWGRFVVMPYDRADTTAPIAFTDKTREEATSWFPYHVHEVESKGGSLDLMDYGIAPDRL